MTPSHPRRARVRSPWAARPPRARAGMPWVVAAAAAVTVALPTPAVADVARFAATRSDTPTVTLLDGAGGRRAWPAAAIRGAGFVSPADLSPAPDGRHLAVTTTGGGYDRADVRIAVVPTVGGPARTLRVDGTTWLKVAGDPLWSADGRELVLSAVVPVLDARPGHRRLGRPSGARCAPETGRCVRVPGTARQLLAPLPDGRLVAADGTWPGRTAPTVCRSTLRDVADADVALRPGGRCDRALDAVLARSRRTTVEVVGRDGARGTVAASRATLRRGVPYGSYAVASSAGVLVVRERLRVRRTARDTVAGRSRLTAAVAVAPSGTARPAGAPLLPVGGGRHRIVAPMYPLPAGDWLGSAGGHNGGRQADVLTRTAADGRTTAVTVGGVPATPAAVSRAAGVALPADDVVMSVAGYEATTRSAIVVVGPIPRGTAADGSGVCTVADGCPPRRLVADEVPPGALVRVPLDGAAPPTVIEPVPDPDAVAYAAW